jgi:hypothetical protein
MTAKQIRTVIVIIGLWFLWVILAGAVLGIVLSTAAYFIHKLWQL